MLNRLRGFRQHSTLYSVDIVDELIQAILNLIEIALDFILKRIRQIPLRNSVKIFCGDRNRSHKGVNDGMYRISSKLREYIKFRRFYLVEPN